MASRRIVVATGCFLFALVIPMRVWGGGEETPPQSKNTSCRICPRLFVNFDALKVSQDTPLPVPDAVIEESKTPTVSHQGRTYDATPFRIEDDVSNNELEYLVRIGFQPARKIPIALGLAGSSFSVGGEDKQVMHRELIPQPDIAYILARRHDSTFNIAPFVTLYPVPLSATRRFQVDLTAMRGKARESYTWIATKETFGEVRFGSDDARTLVRQRASATYWDYSLGFTYYLESVEQLALRAVVRKRNGTLLFDDERFSLNEEIVIGVGIELSFINYPE